MEKEEFEKEITELENELGTLVRHDYKSASKLIDRYEELVCKYAAFMKEFALEHIDLTRAHLTDSKGYEKPRESLKNWNSFVDAMRKDIYIIKHNNKF